MLGSIYKSITATYRVEHLHFKEKKPQLFITKVMELAETLMCLSTMEDSGLSTILGIPVTTFLRIHLGVIREAL